MKRIPLFILAAMLIAGAACASAGADNGAVSKEAFKQDIQPHLSHGCRSWWALMTAVDSPTDNERTVNVLTGSIRNDFSKLAAADPRSQFLAEAATVINSAAYHTAEQNRAAYTTIDNFCEGFRK